MNNQVNVAWMYPDILNLHGERANAQAIKKVADQLNINLQLDRIDDLEQEIDFEKYDLLIFNAGELKVLPSIIEKLKKQEKKLKQFVKDNKYLFVTGTSGAFLGHTITRKNGESFEGLRLLDMDIKERTSVIGDDLYYTIDDDMEIMGCQIQMIDILLKNEQQPFGKIKYGYGNNGDSNEGARSGNIIFTNCLGPALVKNPWLVETILRDICKNKNIEIDENITADYEIEEKSLESTKEFINKKMNK